MGGRYALAAFLLFIPGPAVLQEGIDTLGVHAPGRPDSLEHIGHVRFLAVGDVNLGRAVGQKILAGDTLYPFANAADTLRAYDLVFANLESPISDQGGETVDPGNSLVFTGPPAGAEGLARAGIGIVSTANNHALDYGPEAAGETVGYLVAAGIPYAGTADDTAGLFRPARVTRDGIRFALFACTDLMNGRGKTWKRHVTPADTSHLFPAIRSVRDSADIVVVSYHGGEEYASSPSPRTLRFMRAAADAGADIVLGHHPHVPYGIVDYRGRILVPSLGNFVFYQPARYWTQRSIAVAFDVVRDSSGTRIAGVRCLPVRCGYQPEFPATGPDADTVLARVKKYSSKEAEQ